MYSKYKYYTSPESSDEESQLSQDDSFDIKFQNLSIHSNSEYLRSQGIKYLYHFTDSRNLNSILENGLYSWNHIINNIEQFPNVVMGGNELSRDLDLEKGYQDYARLSFAKNHPMMYIAKKEKRIENPIILKIDLEVVDLPNVLYSDMNATDNNCNVWPTPNHLRLGDIVSKKKYFGLSKENKKYYQAEVFIHQHMISKYILDYEDVYIPVKSRKTVP